MTRIVFYLALPISLGLSGYFLGSGLTNFRTGVHRQVSVKGISQLLQEADTVKLTIKLWDEDSDPISLQRRGNEWREHTINFIKEIGFKENEYFVIPEEIINDPIALYSDTQPRHKISEQKRYRYSQNINIVSSELDRGEKLRDRITALNKSNIQYTLDLAYEFTKLDEIRPKMIGQALQSALKAAEEFAKVSGGHVGKIISADQGRFMITSPHSSSDYDHQEQYYKIKKIKVISHVKFDLG